MRCKIRINYRDNFNYGWVERQRRSVVSSLYDDDTNILFSGDACVSSLAQFLSGRNVSYFSTAKPLPRSYARPTCRTGSANEAQRVVFIHGHELVTLVDHQRHEKKNRRTNDGSWQHVSYLHWYTLANAYFFSTSNSNRALIKYKQGVSIFTKYVHSKIITLVHASSACKKWRKKQQYVLYDVVSKIKIGTRKKNNDQNEGVRTACYMRQSIMPFFFITSDQRARIFVLAKTARHEFLFL